MSSSWQELTFGDFVSIQRGHDLPDQDRRKGSVPILGSFGITGYHDTAKTKGPGVTIGRSGASFGVAAYSSVDYWPLNTALYVTDFKGNDPKFVFYFMKCFDFSSYNSGSAQPSLNRNSLYPTIVKIPQTSEQKQIASLLTALDDRITLLRETNTTLEAIAQALFKSWFVDFDPVRAKQEGREPEGMDADTAALFPDSFEESELGLIPKGWRIGNFGDFITRLSVGKKYDNKTALPEGNVPILDQGKSGIIGFHNDSPSVKASLDEPIVVFANHTCYMRLISYDFSAIQNVLPFVGKDVDTVWAYYATKDRVAFSEYKGHWPDFVIERSVIPNESATIAFRETTDPLIRRIRFNEQQAQTLATLRDTLLPRLISGQLRLPEVEAMVEEAVA